jgi:alpha-beta hydrolase superfamily lysophospholipase
MSHFEFTQKTEDGLSIYFQGWQTEKDPKGAIGLIHGLGEHSGRYSQWAGWLNEAGYSVLSYDLRGHGKSGGPRGHVNSFEDFLRDTDMLISEIKSRFANRTYFLYGHSLGAIIAASYVLHRKPQLDGVILIGLATKTPLQDQKGKIFLAKILGSVAPKFTMDSGLDPETISKDPEVVSRYVNDPLVHKTVTTGFANSSIHEISWINQHVGEWKLPLLLMHGELDILGYPQGSQEFASKVQGDCTLKIWPGLKHEVHNEPEKQEVFEYLRQWLDMHSTI